MRYTSKLISAATIGFLLHSTALAGPNTESVSKSISAATKQPAQIESDTMHYDRDAGIITATGNVEVEQGGIILVADELSYNQKTNYVEATGHISLMEPDGNVLFAEKVALKDDLKQGVIDHFKIRFTDKSLMTADRGERVEGNITTLEKVMYSPCKFCEDDPKDKPLWRVRADEAVINEEKQKIKYKNAFFDVKGVPVLYTPYLSHATPGADRKSGFLIPKYTNDQYFGTRVKAPYYYNLAPDKDITLTPIINSKEAPVLAGEFRHLLPSGRYRISGSVTNPDRVDVDGNKIPGKDVRGHVEGVGDFALNDTWSWGFDAKRASDDTYLERYDFGTEDTLTSRVFTTAIDGRSNINVEALSFQGLQATDDPGKSPLILPNASAHYESQAGWMGSRWLADANALSLTRSEGVSTNRLSLTGGWKLPYILPSGHVFEFNTSLRGDGYIVDEVPTTGTTSGTRDGSTGRLIPQAEMKWTYPLAGQIFNKNAFLEPTANVIVSPYGGNPDKIPNEDAQDVEFSDENLFDANHFTGLDRVESGPRMNYGIRGRVETTEKSDVNLLFGQTYHTKADNDFSTRSGLDNHFSDYAGRIGYQYSDVLDFAYRFRIDKDSYSLNRNTVTAGLNYQPVKFELDYLSVDEQPEISNPTLLPENRELFIARSSLALTDEWELSGDAHRNLESGEWVATKAGLLYHVDCVDLGVTWFKEFTRDRDIRPNTTVSFQMSLKNLGN